MDCCKGYCRKISLIIQFPFLHLDIMRKSFIFFSLVLFSILSNAQTKRPLRPGDIYLLQTIGEPQLSPEGDWVAYSLSTVDSAKDRRSSHIWMINWKGDQTIQMTNGAESESNPKWSPDGKYLSFTAARQGSSSQIWLLDRRGGEAVKLTDIKGDLSDYEWSPDGKKLALIIKDPLDTGKGKTPKPYIINRYRFKQDVSGYLYDTRSNHLYLFDVASKKLDTLTRGI